MNIEVAHSCTEATKVPNSDICFHEIYNAIQEQDPNPSEKQFTIKEKGVSFKATLNFNHYTVLILNQRYQIRINPKKVRFVGKTTRKTITLYCLQQLFKEIEGEFAESYYYDPKRKCYLLVSENSDVFLHNDVDEIFNVFIDNQSIRKSFNRVQLERNNQTERIDLSALIARYYSNYSLKSDFNYFNSLERINLIQIMNSIYKSTKNNFLFITGISGIGKSTTLLNFWKCTHSSTMYINCKRLRNLVDPVEIYRILSLEGIKLYDKYEDYTEYLNEIRKTCYYIHYWYAIQRLISFLKEDNKPHLLLFDQFREESDNYRKEMDKVLEEIQGSKIKVIICSSINEQAIRSFLILQWTSNKTANNFQKGISNSRNYIYLTSLAKAILNEKEEKDIVFVKALKQFSFNPKYYTRFKDAINNNEQLESLVKESKNWIYDKICNFFGVNNSYKVMKLFLFHLTLFHNPLTKEQFEFVLEYVPFKYYAIERENDLYHITPVFPIIKKIIYERMPNLIEKYSIEYFTIASFINNRSFLGVFFEYSIHCKCFNQNTFLGMLINRVIKVTDITSLFRKKQISIEPNTNIYVLPIYQNAKLYDSCIIMRDNNDEYRLILLQMTINKRKAQMLSKNKIEQSLDTITKGCLDFFGFKLKKENVCFYYVLLGDDTIVEIENYCINESLDYILYSVKKNSFYNSSHKPITKLSFIPLFPNQTSQVEPINLFINNKRKRSKEDLNSKIKNEDESIMPKDIFSKKDKEKLANLLNVRGKIEFVGGLKDSKKIDWKFLLAFDCNDTVYIFSPYGKKSSVMYNKKKKVFILSKNEIAFTHLYELLKNQNYNKILLYSKNK